MKTEEIFVEGMSCDHCQINVETALKNLKGVQDTEVDLSTRKVIIKYDSSQLDLNKIKLALNKAGYLVK